MRNSLFSLLIAAMLLFVTESVLAQDITQEFVRTTISMDESGRYQARISALPVDTGDGPQHFRDCLDVIQNGQIIASECFPPTANVSLQHIGTRPGFDYVHVLYFARGNQELSAPDGDSIGGFFSSLGDAIGEVWDNPAEFASPAIDQLCFFNTQTQDLHCRDFRAVFLPFPPASD